VDPAVGPAGDATGGAGIAGAARSVLDTARRRPGRRARVRRAAVGDAMRITGGITANLADRARVARRALGALDAIDKIGWAIRHDRRGQTVAVVVGTAHCGSGRAGIDRAARRTLDTG